MSSDIGFSGRSTSSFHRGSRDIAGSVVAPPHRIRVVSLCFLNCFSHHVRVLPHTRVQSIHELIPELPEGALLLCADLSRQRIHYVDQGSIRDIQAISSSLYGQGNEPDSLRTPLGWHRICEVIGRDAEIGQRFVSRRPEGTPLTQWSGGKGDAILSRILRLEGQVPELNGNSFDRYIYIHGTHQEENLGSPASHGCLRMGNQAIIRWVDWMQERDTYVWIGEVTGPAPY